MASTHLLAANDAIRVSSLACTHAPYWIPLSHCVAVRRRKGRPKREWRFATAIHVRFDVVTAMIHTKKLFRTGAAMFVCCEFDEIWWTRRTTVLTTFWYYFSAIYFRVRISFFCVGEVTLWETIAKNHYRRTNTFSHPIYQHIDCEIWLCVWFRCWVFVLSEAVASGEGVQQIWFCRYDDCWNWIDKTQFGFGSFGTAPGNRFVAFAYELTRFQRRENFHSLALSASFSQSNLMFLAFMLLFRMSFACDCI